MDKVLSLFKTIKDLCCMMGYTQSGMQSNEVSFKLPESYYKCHHYHYYRFMYFSVSARISCSSTKPRTPSIQMEKQQISKQKGHTNRSNLQSQEITDVAQQSPTESYSPNLTCSICPHGKSALPNIQQSRLLSLW